MVSTLLRLGIPTIFLIILGLVIFWAVKSAKDLPRGKDINKLSVKQIKRKYLK